MKYFITVIFMLSTVIYYILTLNGFPELVADNIEPSSLLLLAYVILQTLLLLAVTIKQSMKKHRK